MAVALRINTTIYCANFKFANQYIVCKLLSATALLEFFSLMFFYYNDFFNFDIKNSEIIPILSIDNIASSCVIVDINGRP